MKPLRITRRMAIILILGQAAIDIMFTIYIVANQAQQDQVHKILMNMLANGAV